MAYINRKYLRLFVLAASVGLVLAYCLRHAADLRILLRLSIADIAVLVLLIVMANVVMAYKAFVLLRWLGLRSMTFWEWMRLFTVSRFVNFYITQGANLYRAVKLKRDYSFSYSQSVGITAVITCFDIASILFVTALLIVAVGGLRSTAGWMMLVAALSLTVLLLALPYPAQWAGRLAEAARNRWLIWVCRKMVPLGEAIRGCTHNLRAVLFISATTVLSYLTYLAGTAVCLAAFGRESSFVAVALLASAFVLSQTVKVVPGNVGISELVTGLSAGLVLDEMLSGVMISVIFRVVDFAVVGLAVLAFTAQRLLKPGPVPAR